MGFQNRAEVLALYPEARGKVVMLSAYAEGAERYREIPDPYFGDLEATRRCYALLQTCIHNLAAELGARNPDPVAPAST
jgi:protein-tyrosine-phosphatase